MATVAELREALAATLVSLPGVQESAYLLSNSTPPAAEVEPAEITYDMAMQRGLDKWRFVVRVFVGFSADVAAQKKLDTYLNPTGPTSIKTLIEADRQLGGVCDSVHVTKCSGYRTYERLHSPRQPMIGAEWTVEILASN